MEKFNLEFFTSFYVDTALKFAKNRPLLDSFYKSIKWTISKKLKIPVEFVESLNHPFHWAFFCDENNSPFKYASWGKIGEDEKVRLRRYVSSKTKLKMVDYILKNYGGLLEEKIKKKEINILLQ